MVAFAVALLMGTAVYFRIWARQSSDPSFTVDDREELRRQFERANLEAMDESAEWRMKYDTEFAKNKQLQDELRKVWSNLYYVHVNSFRHSVSFYRAHLRICLQAKTSLSASTRRFELLQKDKEVLKRQIETMKQQCNCTVSSNLTRV
ncbi:hypothetical protein ABZP36_023268 [Zizania latifolia]